MVLRDQLGVMLFAEGNPYGNAGNTLDIRNTVLVHMDKYDSHKVNFP